MDFKVAPLGPINTPTKFTSGCSLWGIYTFFVTFDPKPAVPALRLPRAESPLAFPPTPIEPIWKQRVKLHMNEWIKEGKTYRYIDIYRWIEFVETLNNQTKNCWDILQHKHTTHTNTLSKASLIHSIIIIIIIKILPDSLAAIALARAIASSAICPIFLPLQA